MRSRRQFFDASWPLVDQGVVSLGAFLLNVTLARHLAPTDYGVFALLFSAMLTLQLVNASILFHPLSVSLPVATGERHRKLPSVTFVLACFSCLPLAGSLAVGLAAFGRHDLLLPAIACFVLWQLQEAARRGLLAQFRHRAAVVGDAVSYIGQAIVVLLVAYGGFLTLVNALYAMAATSGIAMLIQFRQTGLFLGRSLQVRQTFQEFWLIGRWILAYNFVAILRIQIFPWALAAISGPVAAALFQASLNVANVANPIIIGLGNVIPQTAARARMNGSAREAWLAARFYVLLGMPFTFAYYLGTFAAPEFVLLAFYGSGSPYLDLQAAVRLLMLAWMLSYGADLICSFLHGLNATRTALLINTWGTLVVLVLAVPMIGLFGFTGSYITLCVANAVRLLASLHALAVTVGALPASPLFRKSRSRGRPLPARKLEKGVVR